MKYSKLISFKRDACFIVGLLGTDSWECGSREVCLCLSHAATSVSAVLTGRTETLPRGWESAVWDVGKLELFQGPLACKEAVVHTILWLLDIQAPLGIAEEPRTDLEDLSTVDNI